MVRSKRAALALANGLELKPFPISRKKFYEVWHYAEAVANWHTINAETMEQLDSMAAAEGHADRVEAAGATVSMEAAGSTDSMEAAGATVCIGQRVTFVGLVLRADLNGTQGTVTGWDSATGRYIVTAWDSAAAEEIVGQFRCECLEPAAEIGITESTIAEKPASTITTQKSTITTKKEKPASTITTKKEKPQKSTITTQKAKAKAGDGRGRAWRRGSECTPSTSELQAMCRAHSLPHYVLNSKMDLVHRLLQKGITVPGHVPQ